MSLFPVHHVAPSHADLLDRLSRAARAEFSGTPRGLWDPSRDDGSADLGRGLLDAFALGLHVLWSYQEAWAAEGFVGTAELDESVDRLLYAVGYRPSPGTAAVGLQHFRCRAGMRATLPPRLAIRSTGLGDESAVVFETLEAIDIRPELNEVQAYLPSGLEPGSASIAPGSTSASSGGGATTSPLDGLRQPAPNDFLPRDSIAASLVDRIQRERQGDAAARRAAKARQDALRFCDVLRLVQESGAKCCGEAMKAICDALAEAQSAGAATPARGARPLSQSQEILARQLKRLHERDPAAAALLDAALSRCADESAEAYTARLGSMAGFLDALIAGLVQDARDQVALLRGADALARLDRSFGPARAPALGRALPGCDTLYLLGPATPIDVRPGDWLVLAEDVESTDLLGARTRERIYRRALRVTRSSVGKPEGRSSPATRITFEPPLDRAYDLDRVVLLGNVVPVSAGTTVEETLELGDDGRTLVPTQGELTWLRDPAAPSGRRPEVELSVGARRWERVESLRGATSTDHVFAVEPRAGGGVALRVGDGEAGAALPSGAPVRTRYRIGLGAAGNRGARRLDSLVTAHPAVEVTWNPLPTSGGTDPEPRSLARRRGPAVTSATDRAVSLDDVRALALAFDGVARARVFAAGTARRRRFTAVVAGAGGAELGLGDLDDLRLYLAARVPPGVTVVAENRAFVPVRAHILLRLARGADPLAVIRRARVRLGLDRDPGEPLGLLDPDRVDLDDDLQQSAIYGALEDIDDLASVVLRALHREGGAGLSDRIATTPRELLGWARPEDGTEGVAFSHEEIKR